MIDNGTYAMNILGVGRKGTRLFLLIGDPHLNKERDSNPLNGLYIIELDKEGSQLSIDYPAAHNHFDQGSYQSFKDFSKASWAALFNNI